MNASLRALALLACLQSAAEGTLRKAPPAGSHHRKAHRRHHTGDKSSSVSVAPALAESKASTDQFSSIHSELMSAWKQKSHMQKLRQTLEAEEKLLSSQQSLAEVKMDGESSAAEGQQVSATAEMIKDAKILLRNSRRNALSKTQKALREAYKVKKEAEQEMEVSSTEIIRATKAREEAIQRKQNIDQVIQAATEEAKYFFNQEVPTLQQGSQDSMGEQVKPDSSATVKVKTEEAHGAAGKAMETKKVVEKRQAAKPQPKTVLSHQQAKAKEQQAQEEQYQQIGEQLNAAFEKPNGHRQIPKKTEGLPEALLQKSVLQNQKHLQATKPAKALVLLEVQNRHDQVDELSEEISSASVD